MSNLQAIERGPATEAYDVNMRRYNDTVTWLAEVLPGSMRTPFEYSFDGQELYASDGSSLAEVFNDAVQEAQDLPPFELRRRLIEKQEYEDMLAMMKGDLPNTMVVVSDFPPELMTVSTDIGGYNTKRKQTMLRVLVRTNSSHLIMYSQSLDGSDRKALESIYQHCDVAVEPGELLGQRIYLHRDEAEQEFIVDELTGVYDRALIGQYGGEWYAGIANHHSGNTYDFVRQQTDLLNAYLATTTEFSGDRRDYALAAAMRSRYSGETPVPTVIYNLVSPVGTAMAIIEMDEAANRAMGRGETQSGCGLTISMTAGEQLGEAGYGNKIESTDKYGSLKFKCPKQGCGYINTRQRNKLLTHCQSCKCEIPKC